ncbi:hypothetical protein [Afipia felis]|uniref:Uncharacterized protein n=2 Tax=Afipia felis TaxID=1035 RepID=A0A380WD65_AFIFE|nr:hypothetical protein [Afipia felis]EKS29314.1 hypothetical protein HMPREF9697_01842 [Afipia felis ATCC 53690]SUU78022.1 Uncharacterised protein [Afipia felis]SUU86087.1 Uncharacterised protein [Afipia felis]
MGFNTVAVLYNDFNFAKEHDIGERIARAMRGWHERDHDALATWFGAGMVVSQAHADYDQIVVVGQNRGRRITDANDLDTVALEQMADCLKRHGWTAKPPSRRKKAAANPKDTGQ